MALWNQFSRPWHQFGTRADELCSNAPEFIPRRNELHFRRNEFHFCLHNFGKISIDLQKIFSKPGTVANPLRYDMILPNGEPLRWDMGPQFVWNGDVPANLLPKKRMPQIRVNLGFAQAADHVIEELADEVHTGMTGNADFPDPPVTMAALATATTTFSNARVAAAQGGPADTAAKDAARDALVVLLRQLAAYVQLTAANDLAMLLSSGFEAVSTNRASVELAKPTILDVLHAGEGKLRLRVGPLKNVRMWEVRHSVTPGVWVSAGTFNSTRDMTLTGLTPGIVYTIQVRALGGLTGASEWSNPVSQRSL